MPVTTRSANACKGGRAPAAPACPLPSISAAASSRLRWVPEIKKLRRERTSFTSKASSTSLPPLQPCSDARTSPAHSGFFERDSSSPSRSSKAPQMPSRAAAASASDTPGLAFLTACTMFCAPALSSPTASWISAFSLVHSRVSHFISLLGENCLSSSGSTREKDCTGFTSKHAMPCPTANQKTRSPRREWPQGAGMSVAPKKSEKNLPKLIAAASSSSMMR
mmetsp:Transcript_27628/g.77233  ORF Transcript_27628/g.77233 Transcript_27628/m.77233 type:complete len:222 (-) Transcript_27628:360-1025(-)